jgi:hypothetical protein
MVTIGEPMRVEIRQMPSFGAKNEADLANCEGEPRKREGEFGSA